MRTSARFGKLSVFFGVAALLAAIAVTEAERLRKPRVGYLLNWMDHLGLIRYPDPNQIPEWRPIGPFDLTDDSALKWVLVYSVCFSIWAMLIALWAEHKREETVGLALGFILGSLALHIHGFQYSMSGLLAGAVIHAAIRRAQRPNPSIERTCPGKPGHASHLKR